MGCFICTAGEGNTTAWYDRILERNSSAFVIASLGGIAVGHVMVSPTEHVNAAQYLDAKERHGFIQLLTEIRTSLSNTSESVTVFEHSAPSDPNSSRSACIDHAHVHVLPGNYSLSDRVEFEEASLYGSLKEFYNSPVPYDGYIMITEPHKEVMAARDIGRSQLLRRIIFESLGEPEAWDYALFPREQTVRETIKLFTTQPKNSNHLGCIWAFL